MNCFQKSSFLTQKKLFDECIDLLFFDVKTLYFESIEEGLSLQRPQNFSVGTLFGIGIGGEKF